MPLRNFSTSPSTCYCFGGNQRPDPTGAGPSLGDAQTIDRWFDTARIVRPAPFRFGALRRTVTAVRQDGARQVDLSLFMSFRFLEKLNLELRA